MPAKKKSAKKANPRTSAKKRGNPKTARKKPISRVASGKPSAEIDVESQGSQVNSYDQVPYPSYPYAASHPDQLFAVSKLFSLDAKHPDSSRILELGCAAGGNIIPMAVSMPSAHFVGVDNSALQISEGSESIKSLKLSNIQLECADILDLDESLGQFDYIICHGVYSWVSTEVQDAILNVCQNHLAENGVAYVSYNTLPGWYMRNMIRGMMMKHLGDEARSPKETIEQSRALLKFLVQSTQEDQSPFANYLRQESQLLETQSNEYLFHDHLEHHNHPVFFQDFVSRAQSHGLQFLGEAALASMWIGNLPKAAAETLEKLTDDVVMRGQYSDFVRNRAFRQTLLCKSTHTVDRQIGPDKLADARFVGKLMLQETGENLPVSATAQVSFKSALGHNITTSDPVYRSMLEVLSRHFPSSLSLLEIRNAIQKQFADSGTPTQINSAVLATHLIQLTLAGAVTFRFTEDRFSTRVAEKPEVSGWVRRQAMQSDRVTNARHEIVRICDVTRQVVPLLNGKRTKRQLVNAISKKLEAGELSLHSESELSRAERHSFLDTSIQQILQQLARNAMLLPTDA